MNTTLLLILQLLAAMLVLIPLNGLIINSLTTIAQKFKLSRRLIILLIVGVGVSLPELFIAINAIDFHAGELALGNSIGTAIILISLIAGIVAIFNRDFQTNKIFSGKNLTFMSFIALLNIVLAIDGRLSRFDGAILILAYSFYVLLLLIHKNDFSIEKKLKFDNTQIILNLIVIVVGLIVSYFIANFICVKSLEIRELTNFPLFFIGAILIAPLGAIPELIFEMELNNRGKSSLTLGELFTSLVTNTTLVIGIIALFAPIQIANTNIYYFTAFYFAVMLLLFNWYARSKNSINWKEGTVLLVTYLIYLLSSITLIFS